MRPSIALRRPRSFCATWGVTPHRAQDPDEIARVVATVGAQRGRSADPASSAGQAVALQHRQGVLAFGIAIGLGQLDIDHQAMTILGQRMAELAELRALLFAFAVEPRLGTGGRGVRLATAVLAPESLPPS